MNPALVLPLFLLVSVPVHSSLAYSTEESRQTKADNGTIYSIAKSLCEGCADESLQFLYEHNLVRSKHSEPPLAWDLKVEKYAKWWAGQRKRDCSLEHSFPENDFNYGENVFWGGGSGWTPTDAVNLWAEEEKYYSYTSNTCDQGQMCGHYTQIVWKSTQRLGCARVVCDTGDIFITCNYDPPGNYMGERPY